MQIPNGCGSFLGLMQLILYAIYRKNKGPAAGAGKGEDADEADEVEDAKKAATLKEELLEAIAPLDRGAEATPEDKDRVDQVR